MSVAAGTGLAGDDLELGGVLELLAARTRTEPGRAAARGLAPASNPDDVALRLERLREMMALEASGEAPTLPPLEDPATALDQVRIPGGVAEGEALRLLVAVAEAGAGLARHLRGQREAAPGLAELAREQPDLEPLRRAARGVFAEDGSLQDRASPELAAIRRRLATAGERLRRRMASFLEGPEAERYLRDEYVTQRNGRFVIPVRADSRDAVEGIVHGASTSGATLFVEPLETVGLNNDLVRLQEEEAAEVRRILAELSAAAREAAPALEAASRLIAQVDLLLAAARLGRDFDARPAALAAAGELELQEARHLLLEARLRQAGGSAVPISLALSPRERVLVVSGPNTGGKTVALKTVGLAALMTQAGLPVPARRAVLPVFRQVLADIGDHQSIAENLSTFSSHITALVRMCRAVAGPALVLLDELGTGTDPEEGAALGVAVVESFRRREALVLVTTHHNGLKAYAEATPGVRNASVEFDEATLRPTYRLLHGVAGRSGGLDIAARLGLPEEIVEHARSLLGEGGRTAERYIGQLAEKVARAEEDRRAAAETLSAARAEREAARDREERQAQEVQARLAAAEERVRKEMDRAAREVLRKLEATAGRREAQQRQQKARAEFTGLARRARGEGEGGGAGSGAEARPGPLAAGDRVRLQAFGREGTVEQVSGERVTVIVAGRRFVVGTGEVTRLAPAPAPAAGRSGQVSAPEPSDLPVELHLLGKRVEEALDELERYLDRALMAGWREVRIVHGHGTGRLKSAVRERLADHPAVLRFRPGAAGEGGDGATVAVLED